MGDWDWHVYGPVSVIKNKKELLNALDCSISYSYTFLNSDGSLDPDCMFLKRYSADALKRLVEITSTLHSKETYWITDENEIEREIYHDNIEVHIHKRNWWTRDPKKYRFKMSKYLHEKIGNTSDKTIFLDISKVDRTTFYTYESIMVPFENWDIGNRWCIMLYRGREEDDPWYTDEEDD